MRNNFRKKSFFRKKYNDFNTDEAFLNIKNISNIDNQKFEGVIEKPISTKSFIYFFIFCVFVAFVFLSKTFYMQVVQGEEYLKKSVANYYREYVLFSKRGIVFDRNKNELIWNDKQESFDFPKRSYINESGFSHLLGFLSYPQKDKSGKYFEKEYVGKGGVEKYFNEKLNGKLGKIVLQVDSVGDTISDNTLSESKPGENITLTIDKNVQVKMFKSLRDYVEEFGFVGASGVIMNVENGQILSMTSYPEYSSTVMTEAVDKKQIKEYLYDEGKPFLNKVVYGEFTPGSVIKPFIAISALENNIIDPYEKIKTNGKLIIPNRWNPSKPSVFRDWKNHGSVNMFDAIAFSSNVYFYMIGGGFLNKFDGLGIKLIEENLALFGFGSKTEIEGFVEKKGLLPSPEWKQKVFKDSPWNVGNTYYTSIGQFGFLTTPLQLVVGVAALANEGEVLKPKILLDSEKEVKINLAYKDKNFKIIKKAMRKTVTDGTTRSLNLDFVKIASKSGSAQIKGRTRMNSWVVGFYPYDKPKYAFVFMAENGPKDTKISVSKAASNFFKSMFDDEKTKQYLK